MNKLNVDTSKLSVGMSNMPETLKKYICTIRETSMDTANHTPMIDNDLSVVNFDDVKNNYRKDLKSNDALFIDSRYRIFFIEFKNGTIDDSDNVELFEKIYDSVNILSDICCKEKLDGICNNVISYLKEHCEYILVYNEEKSGQKHPTKRTIAGLNRQHCPSRLSTKKHLARKSKNEIVLFGLDFFRGYLFCNVHTYTVEEFHQNKLLKWEKTT